MYRNLGHRRVMEARALVALMVMVLQTDKVYLDLSIGNASRVGAIKSDRQ